MMNIVNNSLKTLDVLLVEDDEVDVMNVERSFRKNKVPHYLRHAQDGLQALELLRNRSASLPNVILLDINMPRMGGLEFLRELRSDPALNSITVFVMSTSANAIDKETAFRYNVAGYIVKPLSSDKFNEAIVNLIAYWEICEFV